MSYRNEVREVLQKATKLYTADEIGRLTSFPEETQRLSTILCQLVKEGEVVREGEPGSYRYRLNPDAKPTAQKQKRMRKARQVTTARAVELAGAKATDDAKARKDAERYRLLERLISEAAKLGKWATLSVSYEDWEETILEFAPGTFQEALDEILEASKGQTDG